MVDVLFYYLLSVVDVGLDYMLFRNYFEKKERITFKKVLLFGIALAVSSNWIKTYINTVIANFGITSIVVLLLCLFCFKGSVRVKILCSLFYLFLWMCLDLVVGSLLTMYLSLDIGDTLAEANLRTLAFFLFLFFKFIVIQVIIRKRSYYSIEVGRLYQIQIMIPLVSCLSLHYLLYMEMVTGGHMFIRGYVMMGVLGAINIVQYYVFEQLNKLQNERMESIRIQEMYKYKEEYYQEIEKHQHEIRTMKHDLKNQLILFKTFFTKEKYKQAEDEIDIMIQKVKK